jgi:hypothetical protein
MAEPVVSDYTPDEPCHVYLFVRRGYGGNQRYSFRVDSVQRPPSGMTPAPKPKPDARLRAPRLRIGPAEPEPAPQPERWVACEVRVQPREGAMDDITLVRHDWLETKLADGRVLVRLRSETFPVVYAEAEAGRKWRISRRVADTKLHFADSQNGLAPVQQVRRAAAELKPRTVDRSTAELRVHEAVLKALASARPGR